MLLYKKTLNTFKYRKWLTRGSNKLVCVKCDYCHIETEQVYKTYINGKINSPCKKTSCAKCRWKKAEDNNMILYGVRNHMELPEVKEKVVRVLKDKYGEDHYVKHGLRINANMSEETKKNAKIKARKTCLDKYGVENYAQTNQYKEEMKVLWEDKEYQAKQMKKIEETMLKKYDCKNAFQSEEIKSKIKRTNLEKYGCENVFQSKKIKEKQKKTIMEKYGVESVAHIPGVKEKREATNLEKYGYINPLQNPEIKKKGVESQKLSGKIKLYKGMTINEWAEIAGLSRTHTGALLKRYGTEYVEKYEKKYGELELFVKNILDEHDISYEGHKIKNKKRTDFTIEDKKLIIELDGLYWHSEKNNKPKKYHLDKKNAYNEIGYKSLFFRGDEIIYKGRIVESIILNHLGILPNRVMARKCEIKFVQAGIANQFFLENHLMSMGRGITIGLFYKDKLVSAAQFYNKGNNIYEISRFCNKLFYGVTGGFSRILAFFESEYKPSQIITFIDCRYGTGYYLAEFGFKYQHTFLSFNWTEGHVTYHRMVFPSNTGYSEGLYKIWDCGQAKFIKDC